MGNNDNHPSGGKPTREPERLGKQSKPSDHPESAPNRETRGQPDTHRNAGSAGKSQDIPEQFGRYRIIKPLGQGGMGSVYLAEDSQLSRKVALKIPHVNSGESDDVLERFLREARAAATLDHPNLCQVFDYGELDGIHFLAMAYIEGAPLSKFINPEKAIAEKQSAGVTRKLALALAEAHEKGVIHRDLKPSNIMINRRREPIIMDFGLARLDAQQDMRLTQTGTFLGTPAYVSPEQIKGDLDDIGPGCDIYSLGVILYEMLAGRLPFEGNPFQVLGKILTQDPEPPSRFRPEIDPALEQICLRAMAKDQEQRYQSMREFAEALGDFLRGNLAGQESTVLKPASSSASAAHREDVSAAGKQFLNELPLSATTIHPTATDATEPLTKTKSKRAWILGGGAIVLLMLISIVPLVIFMLPKDEQFGQIPIAIVPLEPDALVILDGQVIDHEKFNEDFELSSGSHHIQVTDDNYEDIDTRFFVSKGGNTKLTIPLVATKDASIGNVAISIEPLKSDAEVQLDGQPVEHSSFDSDFELSVGNHRLQVSHPDFEEIDSQFEVVAGDNIPISIPLTPASAKTGLVNITISPLASSAIVTLDDEKIFHSKLNSDFELPIGNHRLTVTDDNFEDFDRSFAVDAGDRQELTFELVPKVVKQDPDDTPSVNDDRKYFLLSGNSEQGYRTLTDAVASLPGGDAVIEIRSSEPIYEPPSTVVPANTVTSLIIKAADGFTPIIVLDTRRAGPLWKFGNPISQTDTKIGLRDLCLVDANETGAENSQFLNTANHLSFERCLLVSGSAIALQVNNDNSHGIELNLTNTYIWNRSNTNAIGIGLTNGECTLKNSVIVGFSHLFALGASPDRPLKPADQPKLNIERCTFLHNGSAFDFYPTLSEIKHQRNIYAGQDRLVAFHPPLTAANKAKDRIRRYVSDFNYYGMKRVFSNADGFGIDSRDDLRKWKLLTGRGEMNRVSITPKFPSPNVGEADRKLVSARAMKLDPKSTKIWQTMGADVSEIPDLPVGIESVLPNVQVSRIPISSQ